MDHSNQMPIRCGRIGSIFLGLVIPATFIIPFIYILKLFGALEEWQVWVSIFTFLALMISASLWFIIQMWPMATFLLEKNNFRINYQSNSILTPADFSFSVSDITSFKRKVIFDLTYFEIRLDLYGKILHITPQNKSLEELTEFYEFFFQLEEDLNRVDGEDDVLLSKDC